MPWRSTALQPVLAWKMTADCRAMKKERKNAVHKLKMVVLIRDLQELVRLLGMGERTGWFYFFALWAGPSRPWAGWFEFGGGVGRGNHESALSNDFN